MRFKSGIVSAATLAFEIGQRPVLMAGLLALSLGGCATISALQMAVTSTVTPTQAIVAGNAFDAIESGATGFLTFCKANANTDATCIADNRRSVIQYTRAGRSARNQLETIIATQCPAGAQTCTASISSTVYNSVVAAVNSLKATPAANYAGAQ